MIEPLPHLAVGGEPQPARGEEGAQRGVPGARLLGDAQTWRTTTTQEEVHGDTDGLAEPRQHVVVFRTSPGLVAPDGIEGDPGALRQLALREPCLPPAGAKACAEGRIGRPAPRSEEHTSELQSHSDLVCRLLLEKKKQT